MGWIRKMRVSSPQAVDLRHGSVNLPKIRQRFLLAGKDAAGALAAHQSVYQKGDVPFADL